MEKATVCIWMPSGVFTTLGVGHAAIKLETKEGEKHYITWSAQGNPLNAPFKVQKYPRFKHLGTDNFGYQEDKNAMEGFFWTERTSFQNQFAGSKARIWEFKLRRVNEPDRRVLGRSVEREDVRFFLALGTIVQVVYGRHSRPADWVTITESPIVPSSRARPGCWKQ